MFEQMRQYFPVSNARPGPITPLNHPGIVSPFSRRASAACACPVSAWQTRTAFVPSLLSVP